MKKLKLSLIPILFSPVLAVACGAKNNLSYYEKILAKTSYDFRHRNDKLDITQLSSHLKDAKIISWSDGDTPRVEFSNPIKGKKIFNIRVSFIDTPETHVKNNDGDWVDTKNPEYNFGIKAKEFAEKQMPKDSSVKILLNNSTSYNRLVGSIIYKNNSVSSNEYKLYSQEILKNGWAMPLFNLSTWNGSNLLAKDTGLAIADSYNYSIKNRLGIFSVGYGSLDKVLSTHGKPDDSFLKFRGREALDGEDYTIYDLKKIYDGMEKIN